MTEQKSKSRRSEGVLRTGYLIHDVSRLRLAYYDIQCKPLGITRAQWQVLFNLSLHQDELLRQSDLAQKLNIGRASAGELIIRIERGGFICRRTDPNDQRTKYITLTSSGRELLKLMREIAVINYPAIMGGISEEEVAVLNGLLVRMKRNLMKLLDKDRRGDIDPGGL